MTEATQADDLGGRVLDAARRFTRPGTEHRPIDAVAAARDLARTVDDALRASVERAREAGHTWQEVGDVLGTTRQAAFQRFGKPVDPRTGEPMAAAMWAGAAEHAVALLIAYAEGRYDEVRRDFDENMGGLLDAARLAEGWARLAGLVGRYEGMGEPFAHPVGDFTTVDVPLRFEAGELTGQVSYHADGRVGGLFIRPAETH